MRGYLSSFRAASVGAVAAAFVSGPALAGYTITQGSSAPAYAGYTLDFDEPLGPTGMVSPTAWQETHLLTINAGDLVPQVVTLDHLDGYCFRGNSGVNVYFDQDVTQMSFQTWTDAQGGFRIRLFKDGEEVAVFFNDQNLDDGDWFDITTTDGAVFDEVEIWGNGWPSAFTDVDNLSWNTVYTITSGSSAPTYTGYTLDFDEPFGPTGPVSPTDWQETHLLTINSGDHVPQVVEGSDGDYHFYGNSGVNIYFDLDVTELSLQAWTSAPGIYRIRLFDDGEVVGIYYGSAGWINIATANGVVFDEVELYGTSPMGIYSDAVDNLSWNTVYTITSGPSAPTYTGYTLDFDEPGGPTGFVSPTDWQESHGLTINAGDLVPQVLEGPSGYYFYGHSGVNIYFDLDVTELSFQAWTNAPGVFRIRLFDDDEVVGIYYGSAGWIDITTTNGVVFDEVEVYGTAPMGIYQTMVDNLSWNPVPCPGDLAPLYGNVGFTDLTTLLSDWGPCDDCNDCPGDLDGDCQVGFTDLTRLLGSWGPCP